MKNWGPLPTTKNGSLIKPVPPTMRSTYSDARDAVRKGSDVMWRGEMIHPNPTSTTVPSGWRPSESPPREQQNGPRGGDSTVRDEYGTPAKTQKTGLQPISTVPGGEVGEKGATVVPGGTGQKSAEKSKEEK